ncbi:MAG TPA: hypothetical protein VGX92_07415 [Pyrinomonadaceae bacterium]|jgi:hypothetical protein|nr:hypothetical protein [Pyrinomonadaceae bacterium]
MSTTKIVIIVLVLVAVIFALFLAKGALSSDQPKAGNKNDAVEFNKKKKSPDWAKTIRRAMDSMRPKLVLKQKVFPSDPIEIPPDLKQPLRTGTFRLVSGSARVEYEDHTPNAGDLQSQDFDLPNFDNDDPRLGSIVVLKLGGTLSITCKGKDNCRVVLEE